VTFLQRLRWLVALAGFCAACATAPPPPAGETQEQAWHRARIIEALVNGCAAQCPADVRCVDEYGLCWDPCAWRDSGADLETRRSIQKAAADFDPARTWLVQCKQPRGVVQASR